MSKFLIKLFIFISVPAALVFHTAYGLINEPIEKEGFRAWENLSVLEKNEILTGPFYPNMLLHRTETGDESNSGFFEAKKDIIWETDKYGFRKRQTKKEIEIVIIGDSQVVGSSLTQSDILSERLEAIVGRGVYPYAPSHIISFINDKKFLLNPPKIVVLAISEKLFQGAPEIDAQLKKEQLMPKLSILGFDPTAQKVAVIFDRLKKKYFFNYMNTLVYKFLENLRAKFAHLPETTKVMAVDLKSEQALNIDSLNMATDGSMVFAIQADDYFIPVTDKMISWNVWKMKTYQDYLKARGIRFIVAVIPNKENIYYELLQGNKKKPDFLSRFNELAKNEGLEVVNLQTVFDASRDQNPKDLLYHIDDSHWNSRGAQLAAEEIAKVISSK